MRGIITLREEAKELKNTYLELRQITEERIFGFDLERWLKSALEGWMLTEFEEKIICVERHERDEEERKNYRNGFYYRSLQTVLGVIEGFFECVHKHLGFILASRAGQNRVTQGIRWNFKS